MAARRLGGFGYGGGEMAVATGGGGGAGQEGKSNNVWGKEKEKSVRLVCWEQVAPGDGDRGRLIW